MKGRMEGWKEGREGKTKGKKERGEWEDQDGRKDGEGGKE